MCIRDRGNSEDKRRAVPETLQFDGDDESDSSEWEDCENIDEEDRSSTDSRGPVRSPSGPTDYVEHRQEVSIEEIRCEKGGGSSEEDRFPKGSTSSLEGESGVESSSEDEEHCRTWTGAEGVVASDPIPSDEPLASATGKEVERVQAVHQHSHLNGSNREDLQDEEQYDCLLYTSPSPRD